MSPTSHSHRHPGQSGLLPRASGLPSPSPSPSHSLPGSPSGSPSGSSARPAARSPRRLLLSLLAVLWGGAVIAGAVYLWLLRGHETIVLGLAGRELELVSPHWLLLLAALPYLVAVGGASLADFSLPQQLLSLAWRALLLAALALALCRPQLATYDDRVCTVFMVDVSDSISQRQLAAAQALVEDAWSNRGRNLVRLLTFARRPRAVEIPAQATRPPALARHPGKGEGAGSNPQAALRLAYGLYPPGLIRRAVLISDGNQTDGDLLGEAQAAVRQGVRLSTRGFPEEQEREVLVAGLHLPSQVKVGAPFTVTADIHSTHAARASLTLLQDGFPNGLEPRKQVELHPGRNQVGFRSQVKQAGISTYRLQLRTDAPDHFANNNRAVASLSARGKPRVLYLEGETAHAGHLSRALSHENIDVEVRGPRGLPGSTRELGRYDLVLLSDVPSTYVGLGQMAALESYVRDLGGGLVMTGGEGSFGSGGFAGTRIEKLLPVRFESEKRRQEPALALILVIDRSGSMTGPKIELAKEAAKASSEAVDSSDLIGVIAFDTQPMVVVRLQRAANRLRIAGDISRLHAGGGTSILPALQEAYSQLASAAAKVKHVILLSDGQSSYDGIPELVDQMTAAPITISSVGVGGGADRTLLAMIAERGGGRFYYTQDASSIPKIFSKETSQVARSSLVEEPVRVQVVKQVEMLAGLDMAAAPPLRGYVSTKPKPLSEVILVSNYGEPLLARWRVGLGQSVAFTSDVKSRWATAWLRWPGYPKFWAQVVRSTMRHRVHESFDLTATASEGRAQVRVDAASRDDRFLNDLDGQLELVDPEKPAGKQVVPLRQTAPGRYQADVGLPDYGSFLLRAVHRQDGKVVAESEGSVSVSYPREYLFLLPDDRLLARAAEAGGGHRLQRGRDAFATAGQRVRSRRDLWPYLLLAAAGMLLVDVFLRRVRLLGYRPLPG